MNMRSIFSSCLFCFLFLIPDGAWSQETNATMEADAPPQAFITGGDEVCRGDSLAADIT